MRKSRYLGHADAVKYLDSESAIAKSLLGDLGLLKMDFLGLKTLTVLRNTCEMVRRTRGIEIDPERLPLDDAAIHR